MSVSHRVWPPLFYLFVFCLPCDAEADLNRYLLFRIGGDGARLFCGVNVLHLSYLSGVSYR